MRSNLLRCCVFRVHDYAMSRTVAEYFSVTPSNSTPIADRSQLKQKCPNPQLLNYRASVVVAVFPGCFNFCLMSSISSVALCLSGSPWFFGSDSPYMGSLVEVPDEDFSSACALVRSCSLLMSSWGWRSAFTASSPSEASSGFQWPLPDFCLERESCLCLS